MSKIERLQADMNACHEVWVSTTIQVLDHDKGTPMHKATVELAHAASALYKRARREHLLASSPDTKIRTR